jgi:hypothetical protein
MFQSSLKDGLQSLQSIRSDDILAALGLQRRPSNFTETFGPAVAIFAAGAVVGAAAALLLAPKPGPQLRKELSDGARDLGHRIGATASSVVQDVRDALPIGDGDKRESARGNSPATGRA